MSHRHPSALIIEDHRDVRELVALWLELDGYAVETTPNGRAALSKLHGGFTPCVIVMDLNTPVMDAAEFRQEQLRHAGMNRIPVIVYSGAADVSERARDLHVAAHAEKPLSMHHVAALVRQHCLK
ncbi:MAG: response regulator [Candidatus Binatia bacterium]